MKPYYPKLRLLLVYPNIFIYISLTILIDFLGKTNFISSIYIIAIFEKKLKTNIIKFKVNYF